MPPKARTMRDLPEELLALVCEHCDHGSLKMLRLVDNRLRAASSPECFNHFYMGVFENGLEQLESVSKSALAKHVKSFTIYSDILPTFRKSQWLQAIDFRPDYSIWRKARRDELGKSRGEIVYSHQFDFYAEHSALQKHDFDEDQLDKGWKAYLACLAEQRNWRQREQGIRLKEALSSLLNLSEASVRSTTPFYGKTNNFPVWKGLRERIKIGPDDWKYFTDHFDTGYAQACGNAALALTEAVGYRASFSGIKPITKLEVHSSHLGSYEDLMEFVPRFQDDTDDPEYINGSWKRVVVKNPLDGSKHNMRVDGFRNLRSLRMHIPHATLSTRLHGEGLRLETMEFIRAATQLRELDLRYTDDELSPDNELLQLESLFDSDTVIWPYIERLHLATNLSAETLLKFLNQHSSTLQDLELRDMLINNVEHAIQQIPKVLKLRHVYMVCLWDDSPDDEFLSVLSRGTDNFHPYEQGVKDYLLGKSSRLPKLEWDGARGSEILSDDETDESDE